MCTVYCVCQAFGSSETAKHRGNVVEMGCFIIEVLYRQIAGSLAGNIDESSSDDKLRALQVTISLLTSEQTFCYPT